MARHKSGELAKRLKVHPNTIRSWADEYAEFMSPGALAHRRIYSEEDAFALATIAAMRSQGIRQPAVVDALRAGHRVEKLPPGMTDEEEAARGAIELIAMPEYTRVLDVLREREAELARVIDERDKAVQDKEANNARIADLQREIGMLEGQLEALKRERLPARVVLIGLAVIAVVVVLLVLVLSRGV